MLTSPASKVYVYLWEVWRLRIKLWSQGMLIEPAAGMLRGTTYQKHTAYVFDVVFLSLVRLVLGASSQGQFKVALIFMSQRIISVHSWRPYIDQHPRHKQADRKSAQRGPHPLNSGARWRLAADGGLAGIYKVATSTVKLKLNAAFAPSLHLLTYHIHCNALIPMLQWQTYKVPARAQQEGDNSNNALNLREIIERRRGSVYLFLPTSRGPWGSAGIWFTYSTYKIDYSHPRFKALHILKYDTDKCCGSCSTSPLYAPALLASRPWTSWCQYFRMFRIPGSPAVSVFRREGSKIPILTRSLYKFQQAQSLSLITVCASLRSDFA